MNIKLQDSEDTSTHNSTEHETVSFFDKEILQIEHNDSEMPSITLPILLGVTDLLYQLEMEAVKNSYDCVHKSKSQLILINRQPANMFSSLICRRIQKQTQSQYCVILVRIEHDQITIKAVSGVLVWMYKQSNDTNEETIKQLQYVVQSHSNTIMTTSKQHYYADDHHNTDVDEHLNPFLWSSIATTMVYKYCEEHEPTNLIKQSLVHLFNEPILNKQLKQAYELVDKLYEQIVTNQYSYLAKQQHYYPFYKLSIEQYVFADISNKLIEQYIIKYQSKEDKLQNKKQHILNSLSPTEILQSLEVKQIFMHSSNEEPMPYSASVAELTKISLHSTPSQKLRQLYLMQVFIRSGAIDSSKTQELVAMDDELPLIIYVTIMAKVDNIYAQLQMIEDFILSGSEIENDKKMITNVKVSLDYIANEWKI